MDRDRNQAATKRTRVLGILFLLIPAVAVTACMPQPAHCAQVEAFCVGFVTAFGDVKDYGLNQATWETLQSTVTGAKITRLDYIESIDQRDWQKNILFFADNGYDVIVTVGSSIGDAMAAVASTHPSVSFIGVDQEYQEDHENIATIDFPEDQAGFLAGMLAAMVSPGGKVGAICETSGIDVIWQYCEGFRAGAVYEEAEININIVYRDSGDRNKLFNDPEWGREQTLRLIEAGVDTVTGFGGNTAQGAFLTASEYHVLVIGSEADLYYRHPGLQPLLVTSILKDPSTGLSSLILMASRGEPVSGPHAGQITYAPLRLPQFQTDREITTKLEAALQGIRNGEIMIELPRKR